MHEVETNLYHVTRDLIQLQNIGDYKRCRECGETSQSQNFMCKECNRNERFDGTTIAGSLTSVAGIWFTLVVPQVGLSLRVSILQDR